MKAAEHDGPVTLDYASARETGRSWREVAFANLFVCVSVPVAIVALAAVFLMPTRCILTKSTLTRGKLGAMTTPLELYRVHMGTYPPSLKDLVAPPSGTNAERWRGPYVRDLNALRDPWDRPLGYKAPGAKNTKTYDLWSAGPDGVSGTKDDICNW